MPRSASSTPGRGRFRRQAALVLAAATATSTLAACGSETGPPTLVWYINPDVGNTDASAGGQATLAKECTAAANGRYRIQVQMLPVDSTDQRVQLVRRLAAGDTSIDMMSLDPPFIAEAANAGFLAPVPQDKVKTFTQGVLPGAVKQSQWEGKLVAVPFWANTQLLWYKKSVAEEAGLDMSKPVTWDQIITAAEETDTTVEVQANLYEGYAVWINALVESAGGHIVENPEAGQDANIGLDTPEGQMAAEVIARLADSPAANPAMSTADETAAVGAFGMPGGGFMVNWPYVYADPATEAVRKEDDMAWARWPRVDANIPSKPPLGGISIGVSAFSEHTDLAYDAAECITNEEHQKDYMLNAGNPAARAAVYDDPEVKKAYPMAAMIRDSIAVAAPRSVTPYWSDISSALQQSYHTPSSVDAQTPQEATEFIEGVLQGETLL